MKKIKITQLKSSYGRKINHQLCLKGLGLKKIGDIVIREKSHSIMGMVNRINYLVKVDNLDN